MQDSPQHCAAHAPNAYHCCTQEKNEVEDPTMLIPLLAEPAPAAVGGVGKYLPASGLPATAAPGTGAKKKQKTSSSQYGNFDAW